MYILYYELLNSRPARSWSPDKK